MGKGGVEEGKKEESNMKRVERREETGKQGGNEVGLTSNRDGHRQEGTRRRAEELKREKKPGTEQGRDSETRT